MPQLHKNITDTTSLPFFKADKLENQKQVSMPSSQLPTTAYKFDALPFVPHNSVVNAPSSISDKITVDLRRDKNPYVSTILWVGKFVEELKKKRPQIEAVYIKGGYARNIVFPSVGLPVIPPSDFDLIVKMKGSATSKDLAELEKDLASKGCTKDPNAHIYAYRYDAKNPKFPCTLEVTVESDNGVGQESVPGFALDNLKVKFLDATHVEFEKFDPKRDWFAKVWLKGNKELQLVPPTISELLDKNPKTLLRQLYFMMIYNICDPDLLKEISGCVERVPPKLKFGEFKTFIEKFFMRGMVAYLMGNELMNNRFIPVGIQHTFLSFLAPAFPEFSQLVQACEEQCHNPRDFILRDFIMRSFNAIDKDPRMRSLEYIFALLLLPKIMPTFCQLYKKHPVQFERFGPSDGLRLETLISMRVEQMFLSLAEIMHDENGGKAWLYGVFDQNANSGNQRSTSDRLTIISRFLLRFAVDLKPVLESLYNPFSQMHDSSTMLHHNSPNPNA